MKKFLALALALTMVLSLAACGEKAPVEEVVEDAVEEVAVMTYEEFTAAPVDTEVTVETYVQGKQSWWDNKGTFYTQNEEGAYFLYEMPCTEEEYNLLTEGTKIRVTGYKAEWAGEIEIVDATFEILEGSFVAEAFDATSLLGTEELINYQNQKALFKGLVVESVNYKNDEPGDDIYLTLTDGEDDYNFCVEVYLTGVDTEVYTTVGALEAGDKVDVEAFLYWYEGVNPHITAITVVE
ncbi:MAG: hypothetical protein IJD97_05300 [Clostridia bacterium]|nr:hypothetical protein [Clostridia bacterium]